MKTYYIFTHSGMRSIKPYNVRGVYYAQDNSHRNAVIDSIHDMDFTLLQDLPCTLVRNNITFGWFMEITEEDLKKAKLIGNFDFIRK